MNRIDLNAYSIYLDPAWEELRDFIRQKDYSQVAVLVDENTRRACLPILQEKLGLPIEGVAVIPAGEKYKTLDTCSMVWHELFSCNIDRQAVLLNLGGGVVGDLGGMSAGLFKRGIRFIQLPTSLLAMADASLGSKVGVDFETLKNGIGLFADPDAVFIFPQWLQTLPSRQIANGFSEMAKHALIADPNQWRQFQLLKNLDKVDWLPLLLQSVQIKQKIVEADPRESGLRRILNFGHTVGHAIESYGLSRDLDILHGEAIAAGMVAEAYLSHKLLGLPMDSVREIRDFFNRFFEPLPLTRELAPELIRRMRADKKNQAGQFRFSLIRPIGQAHHDIEASEMMVEEALHTWLADR